MLFRPGWFGLQEAVTDEDEDADGWEYGNEEAGAALPSEAFAVHVAQLLTSSAGFNTGDGGENAAAAAAAAA
eukprot:CAMPEP_0206587156 /NCGR_PEP_ID=MMETSP0325_2-20121206/37475_1 /ASSEMBLY_ACC=CAM_ASM_000347 /TAXON_ID=2866 /ORGANISM="Crypthecodinium cohnii, Strain Seligo" /LENGTH=71 /DNA_ID=CAMNT_0054095101 /DNA_START=98 /DNA_END=310 /DNA_ORIENTATION=+